ncbi:hypothetical protein RRG08_012607 [Elysia crispata]|uniref:Uncharacterized protein n=1 Tax=Elysia crispata TaxID=231223 RepID=A0AAE1DUL3_9GAST|nr:hypothetical protein RRG08_012607 [Elysia crispata]
MLVERARSKQLKVASVACKQDLFQTVRGSKRCWYTGLFQTVRGSKRCWYTGLVPHSSRKQAMLVYRTSSTQSEEASDAGIPD